MAETTRKRQRGTMAFPYADLNDAVAIARAVWEGSGLRSHLDRVAVQSGHKTITSGAFRNKVNAARLFGLVTTSGMDIALTPLGRQVIDPRTEQAARAQAFRNVELFDGLYRQHRGSPLPGPGGLEQEMVDFGVTPNQRERARQVFMRSAEQAGYFSAGSDRLIEPATGVPEVVAEMAAPERSEPKRAERPAAFSHPLIEGLFTMLPSAGNPFSADQQKRWLEAARVNLALVYGGSAEPGDRSETK